MVTEDRKRAIKLLAGMGIIFIGGMSKEQKAQHDFRVREITNTLAAVRKERDTEWEAKDLYTHDDMDCACENGRLEERRKWSAAARKTIPLLKRYRDMVTPDTATAGAIPEDVLTNEVIYALKALIEEAKPCGS